MEPEFWKELYAFVKRGAKSFDWKQIIADAGALHEKYGESHAKHEMILDAIEILREEERKCTKSQ